MSEKNVEVVRKAFEAGKRGRIDEAFAIFHPEVEWHTASDEPDAQTYRGLAGIGELFANFNDIWGEAPEALFALVEPQEFIDADPNVIVPYRARLRGRASGAEVDVLETWVLTFKGAQVIEVREYRTKEQALEAAGLLE